MLAIIRLGVAALFPFVETKVHLPFLVAAGFTVILGALYVRYKGEPEESERGLGFVADKLIFLSVGLTWAASHQISWTGLALLGTREIGILVMTLGALVTRHTEILHLQPGNFFGKVTTALQYINFLIIAGAMLVVESLLFLTAISGFIAVVQYYLTYARSERLTQF